MEKDNCLLCKSRYSKILFKTETTHTKFKILQCKKCGLARTSPLPDEELLKVHDESHYYGERENKFIPFLQRIRSRLSRLRAKRYLSMVPQSVKRPKVLDIGCAEGRLLQSFHEYGCDCFGVEHLSYPGERFINREKINYLVGDLDSFELEKESFDIIIMWHVLEHMDDPSGVLERVSRLLVPEGRVILAVPNFSSLEARVFKQFWFHLDVPWHKYHFTKRSIEYLIAQNRYKILNYSTLCFEQGPYGLLQSVFNAMRFPRNELYNLLKGHRVRGRSIFLIIQIFMALIMLIPVFFISLGMAVFKKGSVLKFILKK